MELEPIRFERKYGVLSEIFYQSYVSGEEPEDSARVGDFALWAGAYQTLQERQQQYRALVAERDLTDIASLFKLAA